MIETDVIGPLCAPGIYGDPDPQAGMVVEITPPVALTGWHVNITLQGLASRPDLTPFVVVPAQLRREWARLPGEPQITVALRFADEAEALAMLGGDPA